MANPENPGQLPTELQGQIPMGRSVLELISDIELIGIRKNAEKYLDRRGFPAIFENKANELKGRVIRPDMARLDSRPPLLVAADSAYLVIIWDEKRTAEDESLGRTIFVEALQSGNIIVHGSKVGSTVLNTQDLINKRSLQEALKKASIQYNRYFVNSGESEESEFES